MKEPIILIAVSSIVILWAIGLIQARQRVERARARGLWPATGEIPTDEDVKRLAQAGEKLLAIRLCRQIHGLSLTDAKAAVERMTAPPREG